MLLDCKDTGRVLQEFIHRIYMHVRVHMDILKLTVWLRLPVLPKPWTHKAMASQRAICWEHWKSEVERMIAGGHLKLLDIHFLIALDI